MTTVIFTIIIALVIGFALGCLLGLFKKIFAVAVDEKVLLLREALPGANCGGCGYAGCDSFASAVARGEAPVNGCTAGGVTVTEKLSKIMGVEAAPTSGKFAAVLACRGTKECAKDKGIYNGVKTCRAIMLSVGGIKLCAQGCIGMGDCVASCSFGAISMYEDGLPHVDYNLCTGCGKCTSVCPKKLLSIQDVSVKGPFALCSCKSENKPQIRKDCVAGCFKCGMCEKKCPKQCIDISSGIPKINYDICSGCGTCVLACPDKVIKMFSDIVAS